MKGNIKTKIEVTDEDFIITVIDNLNCIEDYLHFRGEVKLAIENYINSRLKKPDITIIFPLSVSYINSMSLGFLLWLQGECAEGFTVKVYNEDLYEVFDIIGLTRVWNVEKLTVTEK